MAPEIAHVASAHLPSKSVFVTFQEVRRDLPHILSVSRIRSMNADVGDASHWPNSWSYPSRGWCWSTASH